MLRQRHRLLDPVLRGYRAATDTTRRLGHAALTALFVPFGHDGGSALQP